AAGARHDRDRDADRGSPHHVPRDGDVAQKTPPARHDAGLGRALDHVAGDGGVGLDVDADAVVAITLAAAARREIADDVALPDRHAAALVEVGDRDAGLRAHHRVVGDHRALEAELGVERDLADVAARVADDLDRRGGVAAHGRERAVADAVAAHDHASGAVRVDAVAELAGAARDVANVLHAVVEHHGAVLARDLAQDLDAVVAGLAHDVARDGEAAGLERDDGDVGGARDRAAADLAGNAFERNAVAAGADDLAVGDPH